MKKTVLVLWWLLVIVAAAAGLLLFVYSILPNATIKTIGDSLSKDGTLESLTIQRIDQSKILTWIFALLALLFVLGCVIFRDRARQILQRILSFFSWLFRQAKSDFVSLWRAFRQIQIGRLEFAALILILGLAFWARLVLLSGPMLYDESYSYIAFASRSFWNVISDYSLPNNHVLHTIFMYFSCQLFGNAPWAVRLPAFLAGLGLIPAGYLAGRALYNRLTGLLAAALIAFYPWVISYATNARGYTQLALFTLLLVCLFTYVMKHRNIAAWLLIILLGAAGMYTVPVMVYPLGILYCWFFITVIIDRTTSVYTSRQLIKYLSLSGFCTLFLTILCYLPIIYRSGLNSLIANPFVRSFNWQEYADKLPQWGQLFGEAFSFKVEPPALILLVIGLLLAIFTHRWIAKHKIPLWAVLLIFFSIAIPLQRPELLPKVFFSLFPLVLIWTAAGWVLVANRLHQLLPVLKPAMLVAGLIILLGIGLLGNAQPELPYLTQGTMGELETITVHIQQNFHEGDIILVTFPLDPQIWYYGRRHGISDSAMTHFEEHPNYQRAWVLVKPSEGQTLETVIQARSPQNNPVSINTCQQDHQFYSISLFICYPGQP